MLKADLHIHTMYSPDSITPIDKVIDQCRRKGLDCIAVTDHNEIKGALLIQEKAPFKVIAGEEIMTDRGEIIGYFLKKRIKPGMSPLKTVEEIKNQGGLVCVPHPFDRMRTSKLEKDALKAIEKHVDIVEVFNARNLYSDDNQKAREYAEAQGLLFSAGSDAHWQWEIGRVYFKIPDFTGAETFRDALKAASGDFKGLFKKSGVFVHAGTKAVKILSRR